MPAEPADSPSPESPRPEGRRSVRVAVASAVLMFLAIVTIWQIELLFARGLSVDGSLLAYAMAQGAVLGLVVLVARLERRPLRQYGFVVRATVATSLLVSTLLVLGFLVVVIYPGFLFGFGRLPPQTVLDFGFWLLSAPLIAVSQEAAFRGYIFRHLTRALPLAGSIAVSAGLFALATTNFATLSALGAVAGGEYLFDTTIVNLVLGLVLAVYYYKSQWSLVGPVALRTGVLWVATLTTVAAAFPSWETAFATVMLAYGTLFAIVAYGLREPRLQAHKYLGERIGPRRLRFRQRARNRRELRGAVVSVGVMAVAFVATTQLAPLALGTSSPLLAIATGSMVPTLHRGTLVVVEHAAPSSIVVGTIIAFHVSCLPAPTVHRVYRILEGGSSPVYQTKGDANPSPDPCSVPYADVIGRVVAIVPFVGLLALDPLLDVALVALIILAALLVPRRKDR